MADHDSDTPTAAFNPADPPTATFDPAATVYPAGSGASAPATGSAERFTLGPRLATGFGGEVYQAIDRELDRPVAVKLLGVRPSEDPVFRRRFENEARLSGRLQHPGIVPVYALGTWADGRPFFAMKLVEGQTLADLLAARPTPAAELPRFLQIFEQICQAVGYAHSRGVIHRDLKPSNVMVGTFGEVQVMDWGLAKQLWSAEAGMPADGNDPTGSPADATRYGSVMGTPAFMPPEQAAGRPDSVDRRSDVFGLGAVLCVVLTGKPPFQGANTMEIVSAAAKGDLADAFARLDSCGADADLIALGRRCLSVLPDDRPADAGDVAAAVTAHRVGVEERARTAELDRAKAEVRSAEERKRRKVQLGLLTAVAVVLLVGGGGVWWYAADRERKAATAAHQLAARDAEARVALREAWEARKAGWLAGKDPQVWGEKLAVARQALDRIDRLRADGEVSADVDGEVVAARAAVEQDDRERKFVVRLEAWNLKVETVGTLFLEKQAAADFSAFYRILFADFGLDPAAANFLPVGERLLDRSAANDRAFGPPSNAHRPVLDPLLDALDHWKSLILALIAGGTSDVPFEAVGELAHRLGEMPVERHLEFLRGANADIWYATATPRMYRRAARVPDGHPDARAVTFDLRRRLLARDPTDFRANYDLGWELLAAADSSTARGGDRLPTRVEAARLFTAATVARPTDPRGHLQLAKCLVELGDHTGAEAAFRRAVAVAPDGFDERLDFAGYLVDQGRVAEAADRLREAVDVGLRPDQAMYRGLRDDTVTMLVMRIAAGGDPGARLAGVREWVRFAPAPRSIRWSWLGTSLLDTGREREAVEAFRTATTAAPERRIGLIGDDTTPPELALARLKLADALCRTGRYTEAETVLVRFQIECASLLKTRTAAATGAAKVAAEIAQGRTAEPALVAILKTDAELPGDRDLARVAFQSGNAELAASALTKYLAAVPTHTLEEHELRALARAGTAGGQHRLHATNELRDRWRETARTHMRRQLEECKGRWYPGGDGERIPLSDDVIADRVGKWQVFPDFAGIRADDELKNLPAEEQAEWRKLWADVRTVQAGALKRIRKIPPDTLPPAAK